MKRLILSLMLLLATTSAAAQDRGRVRVHVIGELGKDETFRQRVQSWFEPEGFQVTVEAAAYLEPRRVLAPEQGALVDAWITLRGPRAARLYFVNTDPQSGRAKYLLRDLELQNGLDEVAAEALSQAVHWSAVALLEGQVVTSREQVEASLDAAPTPEPAPRKAEPEPSLPPSPPEKKPRWRYDGSLGYALAFASDEGASHGPRLAGFVDVEAWLAQVRLQAWLPHSHQLPSAKLELDGGSFLLSVGPRLYRSDWLLLTALGGASLEWTRFTASGDAPFTPEPSASELRPSLSIGARVALGRGPRVVLVPELSLSLRRSRYEVAHGAQREVAGRSPLLTPMLGLELSP
jgi:hypothetical protein